MKLGSQEKNFLLGFLGILLVVITYFFVYKKANERIDEMLAHNSSMSTAIVKLESHEKKLAEYEKNIMALRTDSVKLKNTYPSTILSADKILYANKLENLCDVHVSYIGMEDAVVVDVPYPTMEYVDVDAEMEGQPIPTTPVNPNGVYLMQHGLVLNYTGGYESIKHLLRAVVNDAEEKAIHSVSLSYNPSTGVLTGAMSASMYSMTGTTAVYSKPEFTGIGIGTEDIFHTVGGESPTDEADTAGEADTVKEATDAQ